MLTYCLTDRLRKIDKYLYDVTRKEDESKESVCPDEKMQWW